MSARGVEEVCSTFRLVTDLLLAILLGSAHCFLHHILRKLICGMGHLFADSIYKPALTLCFNGFMWPCISVIVQLSKGCVLVIRPLLEVAGLIFSWMAHVCRAFRLVNLTYKNYQSPSSDKSAVTQSTAAGQCTIFMPDCLFSRCCNNYFYFVLNINYHALFLLHFFVHNKLVIASTCVAIRVTIHQWH